MAKTKRSDRTWIDTDGKETEQAKAVGARYSLVQQDGVDSDGDPKYVSVYDCDVYLLPSHPKYIGDFGAIALGAIGVHTKVGNVVNTVLNNEKQPGTLDEARQAAIDFVAGLADGKWREPGVGVGPRYDTAILAKALAAATGKPETEFVAKMDWKVDPKTGARAAPGANGDYAKGTIGYPAFAMRNKTVAGKYAELGGSTGKEVGLDAL